MEESLGTVVREADVQKVWEFIAVWVNMQKSERELESAQAS